MADINPLHGLEPRPAPPQLNQLACACAFRLKRLKARDAVERIGLSLGPFVFV
jgi:hypothetical protein